MMWGPSGSGWWGFVMGLVMLLFVALLVVGIVVLVRSSSGGAGAPRNAEPTSGRALDILDERFARGEIDAKEYEERRRILTERR